jgi:hypothetical protein
MNITNPLFQINILLTNNGLVTVLKPLLILLSIKVLFMDLSLNVIRISEIDAMGKTNIVGTSGDKPVVHPVITKVTLLCHVFLCIKGNGMIRAGIHTKPAAGARFLVQDHDTVIPFCNGLFRATVHTWGVIAVYTDIRLKYYIRFIVNGTDPPFKNVDQFDTFGSVIFLLAGHFAGFASPAG